MRFDNTKPCREKGIAAVEAALILPVVLMLLFCTFYTCLQYMQALSTYYAVADALRNASVGPTLAQRAAATATEASKSNIVATNLQNRLSTLSSTLAGRANSSPAALALSIVGSSIIRTPEGKCFFAFTGGRRRIYDGYATAATSNLNVKNGRITDTNCGFLAGETQAAIEANPEIYIFKPNDIITLETAIRFGKFKFWFFELPITKVRATIRLHDWS